MTSKSQPSARDTRSSFLLRPSPEMHDKVKALAKENHRSINSQYLFMIQDYIDELDKESYYAHGGFDAQAKAFLAKNTVEKLIENDDIEEVKAEIDKQLPRLRQLVQEKAHYTNVLENNLFAMKTFLDNNHQLGIKLELDSIQTRANQLATQKQLLKQGHDLLHFFQPIDPQSAYEYAPHPENGIPVFFKSLSTTVRINDYIKNNFDTVITKLLEIHRLINKSNEVMAEQT